MTIIMCRGKKVWTGTAKSAAEVAGQLVQVGKLNCSIKTHFHIFWAYFFPLNKLYSYSLTWLDWYYPCLLGSWQCAFIFTSWKCSHHTNFEDNLTSTDVQFCKNSSLFTKKTKNKKNILRLSKHLLQGLQQTALWGGFRGWPSLSWTAKVGFKRPEADNRRADFHWQLADDPDNCKNTHEKWYITAR